MPIAVAVVALTAGLAVATFVKAFGVGFLARPRSDAAATARERPPTMLAAMGVACGRRRAARRWRRRRSRPVGPAAVGATGDRGGRSCWRLSLPGVDATPGSPSRLILLAAAGAGRCRWWSHAAAARRAGRAATSALAGTAARDR